MNDAVPSNSVVVCLWCKQMLPGVPEDGRNHFCSDECFAAWAELPKNSGRSGLVEDGRTEWA